MPRYLRDSLWRHRNRSRRVDLRSTRNSRRFDLYEDAISWTPFRSVEHARSAGEMLARLHLAAESLRALHAKAAPPGRKLHHLCVARCHGRRSKQYLAARPELNQHVQTRRDCEEALYLLAPFHDELKPLLPSLQSALDTQRPARLKPLLERFESRRAAPHLSSISDWPIAPTPSTTSPRPSSATSWSGSFSCTNPESWRRRPGAPRSPLGNARRLRASPASQPQPKLRHWPRCSPSVMRSLRSPRPTIFSVSCIRRKKLA